MVKPSQPQYFAQRFVAEELPASPASPNHSPLSPTRIVRSKPIEVKPVEATVATAEERLSSNPQEPIFFGGDGMDVCLWFC